MREGTLPAKKMGTWKSETAHRHRRGPDFQRFGFLHHRLPERFLSRSGEKRRACRAGECGQTGGERRQSCCGGDAGQARDKTEKAIRRMIKLICPECRRENEPERIYCHDCGARLDRTALAKIAPKGENAKETHRRLRTMLDPQRAKMRLLFFKVSKLILGAFAA